MLSLAIPAACSDSSDAVSIVHEWTAARNDGDIDRAMRQLAPDANVFGLDMALEQQREQFVSNLRAQEIAGWYIIDRDCADQDSTVTCRYQQGDEFTKAVQVELTGTHTYRVENAKIVYAKRAHDPGSQEAVYSEIQAFRTWVQRTHRDRERVIWTDPHAAFYTTEDGAKAVLDLIDEYTEQLGLDNDSTT